MTTDAILNIMFLAGIPGLMALAGCVMAARELPSRYKWFWVSVFVVLFMVSLVLAAKVEILNTARQKEQEQKANESELNRVRDTQYMKGKLDTMAVVLGSMSAHTPGEDDGDLAASLALFAKQSPQQTEAKRRADAQLHLGKLLVEGRQLSECMTAKDGVIATASQKKLHKDWTTRTYAALASEVNPEMLSRFGEGYQVSVVPGQESWLKTLCWNTRLKVSDLEGIMADEFQPEPTEAEVQRRSQAQLELGKVLAEGKSLRDRYCVSNTKETQPTLPNIDSAFSDWDKKAYATVTGWAGAKGMELWDESGNAYPATAQDVQQRCGQMDMRLLALGNTIRVCCGRAK